MSDPFRDDTLTVADVDVLRWVYSQTTEGAKDVRLVGSQLRLAKRLSAEPLAMMAPGRLSERHYVLTDKGRTFVKAFNAAQRSDKAR